MKFKVEEIAEREKEAFNKVITHPVQSWEWGEFRKKTGNRVVRLGLFSPPSRNPRVTNPRMKRSVFASADFRSAEVRTKIPGALSPRSFNGKRLIEGYQLTIHRIPYTNLSLGVFLKGPKPSKEMLEGLREFAKNENLVFIRMEPNTVKRKTENAKRIEGLLKRSGAKHGRPFFTKSTFLIDLTKSEGELLAAMHPKTRYNIRVAQKHGVEIIEDNSPEAFGAYLNLMDETTRRQGFYAHTQNYHRLMWENLHPAGIARLLAARYKGEIITVWILFVLKDTLYYPYGASTDKYKNIMANYAMMWEAIKFGGKLGLKTFDLWGREEGKGFTRFKERFSPKVVEFLGTWDLVINPVLYMLYRIAEEVRWKILKLPLPLPKPRFR